jgi:hypothetical protein
MDNGLFQLLFFGVLIVASLFDAVTRRRRRQRMQEMEWEEETVGSEEQREEIAVGPQGPGRTAAPEPSDRRETADAMVPADLWQILTGQQPLPGGPVPEQPQSAEAPSASTPLPEVRSTSEVDRPAELGRGGARPRTPAPESTRKAPSPFEPMPFPKMPEPTWIGGRRSAGFALPYVDLLRTGGGPGALRKAIVLTEVLGPPAALRPTGWDGGER